jgi:LacI family transcriptional regulator
MTCCRQSIDQLWFYHSEPLSHWLSQLPHSTALFAADDTMSRKIVEQCHVLGLNIPYDVSVLGVDNDEISCLLSYPELSSMEMDVQQAGYEAAMLIEKMMNDPGYEGHDIYVKTIGVVERNSTNYFAAKNVYIRETLKYIFEHLADIRTIADLVEKLPMSRRVFEKRFYEEMKTTPYSYICKMRMERLAQLLITSDDSIDNLCERVGGLNSKNLSRQFKKYMGMTPVEYRNKYKKT